MKAPNQKEPATAGFGRAASDCSPSREFVALQNPKTKRWVYCSPFHTTDYTPLERRPDSVLCRVNCEALGETFDASGAIVRPDKMDHFPTFAAARAQFEKENDEMRHRAKDADLD